MSNPPAALQNPARRPICRTPPGLRAIKPVSPHPPPLPNPRPPPALPPPPPPRAHKPRPPPPPPRPPHLAFQKTLTRAATDSTSPGSKSLTQAALPSLKPDIERRENVQIECRN